jgi:hypothetical protein
MDNVIYTFRGQKGETGPQSPKKEYMLQNLYCCVISRLGVLYTAGGQKGENKPSGNKHGFRGPKSVLSCDISIDQEFYIDEESTNCLG